MLSRIISNPPIHPKYQLCIIVPNGASGTTLKHLYTSPRTGRKFASATHADNYTYEEAQKLLKSAPYKFYDWFIQSEYERLAVLANDALDLYLKGVISLHEFKLIIADNKN